MTLYFSSNQKVKEMNEVMIWVQGPLVYLHNLLLNIGKIITASVVKLLTYVNTISCRQILSW